MKRDILVKKLQNSNKQWDFIVIGGGSTGLGIALDAASRGYSTVLLEQNDFGKGTSGKSTKLVHGGVRYLAQMNIQLVLEALYERGLLLKNAPHLVKNQSFLIPTYRWWETPFYTIGLTLYDLLAGRHSFGRSVIKKRESTLALLPTIRKEGLKGGVLYHDGQFDDTRLAVNIAQTATEHSAVILNYMKVTSLIKKAGKVTGVNVVDSETNRCYHLKANVVVNATGIFTDQIIKMDNKDATPMISPSQGVHLVLDHTFLQGNTAIMIPKTNDGRVLFVVPWHNKVVVGTTDTPMNEPSLDPKALDSEIDFILDTAGKYLTRKPTKADIRSVFAGMRPLIAHTSEEKKTKEISRSHKVICSPSSLITVIGGKWTTYRKMAEDTINTAIRQQLIPYKECTTHRLLIHGFRNNTDFSDPMHVYGSDSRHIKTLVQQNSELGKPIHKNHPYIQAQVIWAVREEMARTVEDVLSRRIRLLLLDARAAMEAAPLTARLMARELNKNNHWEEEQVNVFTHHASSYIYQ